MCVATHKKMFTLHSCLVGLNKDINSQVKQRHCRSIVSCPRTQLSYHGQGTNQDRLIQQAKSIVSGHCTFLSTLLFSRSIFSLCVFSLFFSQRLTEQTRSVGLEVQNFVTLEPLFTMCIKYMIIDANAAITLYNWKKRPEKILKL